MYSQNNGYISMPCTVTKKNLIFWAPSYINSVYVMEPSESEARKIRNLPIRNAILKALKFRNLWHRFNDFLN